MTAKEETKRIAKLTRSAVQIEFRNEMRRGCNPGLFQAGRVEREEVMGAIVAHLVAQKALPIDTPRKAVALYGKFYESGIEKIEDFLAK